jgi:hypothetical protein
MKGPLVVLGDGESRDPWRYPDIPPDLETPALDDGESLVHVAYYSKVSVELCRKADNTWREVWSSPETATTTVTDRRVVVGCRRYDIGSRWVGSGVGAAVAFGATAISRARAQARTRGSCLAIQLRHEWTSHVLHTANPAGWQGRLARLGGMPNQQVGVVAWDHGHRWRLLFSAHRPGVDAGLASYLAWTVVCRRWQYQDLLDEDDRELLRSQGDRVRIAAAPGTTEALYVPGAYSIGLNPATQHHRSKGATQ